MREVGKWPVWKVDLWSRREPPADLGSKRAVSMLYRVGWKVKRTLGVVLQDLQVHVCVGDDDVELLVERQELGRDAFEPVFASAKQHHLVRLFL